MRYFRLTAPLLALLAAPLPALAKDAKITINWGPYSASNISITRMRVGIWPEIRNKVCATYRRGQYPGSVIKTGGKVIVSFTGAGGSNITSFTVTRDKC